MFPSLNSTLQKDIYLLKSWLACFLQLGKMLNILKDCELTECSQNICDQIPMVNSKNSLNESESDRRSGDCIFIIYV